jgi:hypothetical protein
VYAKRLKGDGLSSPVPHAAEQGIEKR